MSRLLDLVRVVAAGMVAVPALWIGYFVLREGMTEPGGMSLDRVFHLGLAAALLLLFADFLVAIHRSDQVAVVVALGTGGFLACSLGGILSELLGPPVLLLIFIGAAILTVFTVRPVGGGLRAQQSHSARAHEAD